MRPLVENGKKHEGKFVALKSFSSNKVVSSGTKPKTVMKEAKKKGVDDPVILYVPKKDERYIY